MPVCFKAESVPGRCILMEGREASAPLPSCPSWVFANAGASGSYRSMLGPELLPFLDQLTAAERLTLAQDISALVMSGRLAAPHAISMLQVLANDPEPLVAAAARGARSRSGSVLIH